MKIGIDIDGCLNDSHHTLINEGIKWQLKNGLEPTAFHQYIWDFEEVFDMGKELNAKFINEELKNIINSSPARPEASAVTKKLAEEGHVLYIITGRGKYKDDTSGDNLMQRDTIKWLKDNNIVYHHVVFNCDNKAKVCVENNIDVMVEDLDHHAHHISDHVPVLHFHNTYNNHIQKNNVIPVYAWFDVYAKIKEIDK